MKNLSAILLLLLANTISGVAQGISIIAIPWYFTQIGEVGKFGWTYTLVTVLALFWAPYAGTLIDRFNRKNIFLVLTATIGTLIVIIAGLGFYWQLLPWYMVSAVFVLTFLNYNLHYPTVYAFVQEITEQQYYGRLTSILEIQNQITTLLSGAVGALLLEGIEEGATEIFGLAISMPFQVKAWTIYEIFLMDASTYFASFLIISLIRFESLKVRQPDKGTVMQQLKIGWEYLIDHRYVLWFGVASYAVFVTVLLTNFYLAALYVKQHLLTTGDVYAFSEVCYAIGAIAAGILIRRLLKGLNIPSTIVIMTLMTAAMFFILALTRNIAIFYGMFIILGLTNAGARIQRITFLFETIPNKVFGRTGSIFFIANTSFRIFFLAVFAIPFFQQEGNVTYDFAILGVFLILAAIVLLWNERNQVDSSY